MLDSYRTPILTLANALASGTPPKGEACFDAGRMLHKMLAEPHLFGVSVERTDGGGTEYLAVLASSDTEAAEFAISACAGVVESVTDLESVIDDQYEGVAVLTTGGF